MAALAAPGQFGGRVGAKAGGFISKKFFHPSNNRNLEKVWLGKKKAEEAQKRQEELERRREEERQVEDLRRQSAAMGSSSSTAVAENMLFAAANTTTTASRATKAEEAAAAEHRQRKAVLAASVAQPSASPSPDSSDSDAEDLRDWVKSRYEEDVHCHGHTSVWGSWFDLKDLNWGYHCCKGNDKAKRCPQAKELRVAQIAAKRQKALRLSKRQKKAQRKIDDARTAAAVVPASSSPAPSAHGGSATSPRISPVSDPGFVKAHQQEARHLGGAGALAARLAVIAKHDAETAAGTSSQSTVVLEQPETPDLYLPKPTKQATKAKAEDNKAKSNPALAFILGEVEALRAEIQEQNKMIARATRDRSRSPSR